MKKYSKVLSIPFGMVIFMCLGSVYSWSIFKKPLENMWDLSSTESSFPYVVFLICYSLAMPVAGNFIQKLGPKFMIILGGVIVSLGWILSSFANNITILVITYGIMGGTGVGIVYGAPMAVSAKWFPEKKGLAVGMTLAGFGLSPFITAPLARKLIESYNVFVTFKILGIAFLFIILILSLPLRFPKEDEVINKNSKNIDEKDKTLREVLTDARFYLLWIGFAIGTFTGLMAIGISSPVGEEIIKIAPHNAAYIVSIFAIFNGIGRPIFGILTDKFHSRISGTVSYLLIIIASIIMLFAKEGMVISYVIAFCIFWFILGGWLAIAPTAVSNIFGAKSYARNYGFMFTAYGVGAVGGGIVAGEIRDMFGSYQYVFIPTLIAALIGIIVLQFIKRK